MVHPLAIGVIACAVGPGGNEVSGAIALSPAGSAGMRIARLIPCLVGGPGALGARKSYFSVKRAMAAAEFS